MKNADDRMIIGVFFAPPFRSELAREEPEGAACILNACVIVNVLREQARSYKGGRLEGEVLAPVTRDYWRFTPL